ncbi:hypothetical protein IC614_11020 [Allosphingosinicella flava]|uniref:PAS domain-containing protein n=1 Tax=Allosphingosinicella flava TaxID=2771430 RepID=A0A7T2GJ54_9SPHN|nr:hypothetical protein [Sphingosinicella flava]QPQ54838.1 hypothetical protein IC614_11020 [Sphingosinicella flava]
MDALLTFEEEWLPVDEAEASGGIDALLGGGMDERRLHLRAHERWVSARGGQGCPTLASLLGERSDEFAPYSLILDFCDGADAPVLRYVGKKLSHAFGITGEPLLARLAAHYALIVESETPVGFEAELANGKGGSTLYRGILMPIADGEGRVTALYGVINSKEVADNAATITLALEIDQAMNGGSRFAAEEVWAAQPFQHA